MNTSRASWAVVTSAVANLRGAPDHTAELVSQRLLGEVLEVEGERRGWLRARGWDGYRGWVRDWSVRRVEERTARRWEQAARAVAWGHGAVAVIGAGQRLRLPWGARLILRGGSGGGGGGAGVAGDASSRPIGLPDGRPARLERGSLRAVHRPGGAPGAAAVRLARAALGAPYLWGGTTPWGFDCSGLVQWAYALAGVALPRDARDQWGGVRRVPAGDIRTGDLVFFGRRGSINHVAMVTRAPRIIHAYGQVEETRLDRRRRPELAATVVGVGRPLGV